MGQLVVDIAVVVSQLGFCTAYCVFVAENVQAIVFEAVGGMVGSDEKRKCSLSGFLASDMLVYYIILMCIPLLIPVTWLRQLKYFAVTNTLASLLVVVSVLFMLIALVKRYVEVGPEGGELELYNLHGTLVYVGVAMYAFEGVGVLLPVQESMAEPHRMPEVVCWTLSLACLLQVVFASLAYLNYRQHTASIVTISLADGHIMGGMGAVIAVQVAWVVEVLLTFPLQLFPAVRILERRCSVAERNSGMSWTKNLMRAGLVLLCMFISMFGYTSVDNLVALIGALGCVPLCIIYPALFHYKVKHGDVREFSCPEVANGSVESSLLRRESCGESGDLAIVALGGVGSALAAVLAVGSWMSADFHFQSCVMRP
ncbi:unnamed protein product [Effrenium voratum]|nr:unnamed protein product [Effrenium voratum]